MKKKDVVVGQTYTAKISNALTEVRIDWADTRFGGYHGTNLRTGRSVRIKSAAKLREHIPALTCPNCGKEVWDGPKGSKLAKCWNCMLAFDTMED